MWPSSYGFTVNGIAYVPSFSAYEALEGTTRSVKPASSLVASPCSTAMSSMQTASTWIELGPDQRGYYVRKKVLRPPTRLLLPDFLLLRKFRNSLHFRQTKSNDDEKQAAPPKGTQAALPGPSAQDLPPGRREGNKPGPQSSASIQPQHPTMQQFGPQQPWKHDSMNNTREENTDLVKTGGQHHTAPYQTLYPNQPPFFPQNAFSMPGYPLQMPYSFNQMAHGPMSMPMSMAQNPLVQGPESQQHRCAQCGRLRSAEYHHKHPIFPGQVPRKTVCRQCKKRDVSTDEESPNERRAVKTHQKRSKKRERNPRHVSYAPLPASHRVARSSSWDDAGMSWEPSSQGRRIQRYSPQLPTTRLEGLQIKDYNGKHQEHGSRHNDRSRAVSDTRDTERRRHTGFHAESHGRPDRYVDSIVGDHSSEQGRNHRIHPSIRVTTSDARESETASIRPQVRHSKTSYQRSRAPNDLNDGRWEEEERCYTSREPENRFDNKFVAQDMEPTRRGRDIAVEHFKRAPKHSVEEDSASITASEDLDPTELGNATDISEEARLMSRSVGTHHRPEHRGVVYFGRHRPKFSETEPRENTRKMPKAPSPPTTHRLPLPARLDSWSDAESGSATTHHQYSGHNTSLVRSFRDAQWKDEEESEVEAVPASIILRPGDRVTVIETRQSAPSDEYDWYDQGGRRARTKEV